MLKINQRRSISRKVRVARFGWSHQRVPPDSQVFSTLGESLKKFSADLVDRTLGDSSIETILLEFNPFPLILRFELSYHTTDAGKY